MADGFTKGVLAILAQRTGPGNYTETVLTPTGQTTNMFCWASGMRWGWARRDYGQSFGPVPAWVLIEHPTHRGSLCLLALEVGAPLPPARPPAGQGATDPHPLPNAPL